MKDSEFVKLRDSKKIEVDLPSAELEILTAIQSLSFDAGSNLQANEAMKFSQAALNMAHALAALDSLERNR